MSNNELIELMEDVLFLVDNQKYFDTDDRTVLQFKEVLTNDIKSLKSNIEDEL